MKHFFSILMLIFIFSCSSDNSEDIQISNPTIEGISVNTANIGDVIIINGQNFNPDAYYTVRFNGVQGQILNITPTSISVVVPIFATSGPIVLEANGATINVGTLTISSAVQNRIFAYKAYNGLIEINPNTGAEIGALLNTGTDYLSNLNYFAPTNQIIGQKAITDDNGATTYKFLKIKLSDNTVTETSFIGYESLVVTTTGKLYGYKAYQGIVELNPNTGSEIGNVINTGTNSLSNLVYHSQTDEIIGQETITDNGGNNTYRLYKIKLSDHSIIGNGYLGYERLIPANNGKLYAYKSYNGIIEINPNTGAEIGALISTSTDYVSQLVFYPQTNEIMGQKTISDENGNNTYKFLKVKLTDNTQSESNLIGYEDFIVTN